MGRWHDQTILSEEGRRGNCMQAAVASLLGLPMRDVPHFAERPDRQAHLGLINFAASYGFDLMRHDSVMHYEGLYLGCGPTERGTHHMVVMRDGALAHDPHPSRAGLLKVEFVYTLLPLDPAVHVAACVAAKVLAPLLEKASKGPWAAESLETEDGYGKCGSSQLVGPDGKTILDAFNSGVACMAEETDEDGRWRYDEQGAADTAYVETLDRMGRALVAGLPASAFSATANADRALNEIVERAVSQVLLWTVRPEKGARAGMSKASINDRNALVSNIAARIQALSPLASAADVRVPFGEPPAAAPWPAGCIKPNACSRHQTCVYAMSAEKCRHFGQDLSALIAQAEQGGSHGA